MRALKSVGLLLGLALVMGTISCGQEAPEEPESPSAAAPEESEADANSAEESADDTVCDDEAFTDAATIPPQLAELDVPFYACAHEMVAISESDPLFVGEYDTTHESILVEMSITDQFDASDWEVSERTVEGDNAITHAQK